MSGITPFRLGTLIKINTENVKNLNIIHSVIYVRSLIELTKLYRIQSKGTKLIYYDVFIH